MGDSNHDIKRALSRRTRNRWIGLFFLVPAFALFSLGVTSTSELLRTTHSVSPKWLAVCAAGAILFVTAWIFIRKGRLPPEVYKPKNMLVGSAHITQRRAQFLFIMPIVSAGLAAVLSLSAFHLAAGGRNISEIALVFLGLATISVFVSQTSGFTGLRRLAVVLEDEPSRMARHRGQQVSYWVLFWGVLVIFAVGLFQSLSVLKTDLLHFWSELSLEGN